MLYNPGSLSEPSNRGTNSVGSQYAAQYGHEINLQIAKLTNKLIFDSARQQFYDLQLFNAVPSEPVNSDEFFYQEAGDQREPIPVAATAAATSYPNTQVISVSTFEHAAVGMMVAYPNNQKGYIKEVDEVNNTIVVQPQVGDSVPQVVAGDMLAVESPVEADGTDRFAAYFRMKTIERYNYVQLFSRALKYGEVELFKYMKSGSVSNFLTMEKRKMYQEFRADLSNVLWNGKKGEVMTADGPAKTTEGIIPAMINAGSPRVTVSPSQITQGLERLATDTEYGPYGATRMLYARNDIIRAISKAYKDAKTRYRPNDKIASLMLDSINIGSTNIVLVPHERFTNNAYFPSSFANQAVLLDQSNIRMQQMWNERSGETPDNRSNGWRKRSKEIWVDYNFGLKFNNPLACGFLEVV